MTSDADISFAWTLRRAAPGGPFYFVDLGARGQYLALIYKDDSKNVREAITPRVPIPGLQTERPFTLAVVVEETRFTIFLNEHEVAQASDTRIRTPWTPGFSISSESDGRPGRVRIVGARFYELPPSAQ